MTLANLPIRHSDSAARSVQLAGAHSRASASNRLGSLIRRISAFCTRARFEAVEPVEKVLDVRGKFLARDIFCCPSQRRTDAIEEVDVVNANCIF